MKSESNQNGLQSDSAVPTFRGIILLAFYIMIAILTACKGAGTSGPSERWNWIVEGPNNDCYFVDRESIQHMSDDVVRVSFKYLPAKSELLTSLQGLSKEFGKEAKDSRQEYTISTWEFNCVKPEARCLSLTHLKKNSKVASYEYPQQRWSSVASAANTKMLRDVICAEASRSGK